MIREEEGSFKTNAVWRRWWKKEQEERVMNTRREGKVNCKLVSYRGNLYLFTLYVNVIKRTGLSTPERDREE